VLVLFALRSRVLRFGELRKKIGGVSEKMLAQTLSTLERDGFVQREAHAVIPPRVDYSLTPLGVALAERVEHLVEFVESNVATIIKAQSKYDRRRRADD
jgi:DNA-binding HxlR family transcriptional regulator